MALPLAISNEVHYTVTAPPLTFEFPPFRITPSHCEIKYTYQIISFFGTIDDSVTFDADAREFIFYSENLNYAGANWGMANSSYILLIIAAAGGSGGVITKQQQVLVSLVYSSPCHVTDLTIVYEIMPNQHYDIFSYPDTGF